MLEIKYVTEEDKEFWFTIDRHLALSEFHHIVDLKRGYVIIKDGEPMGVVRWNLFWDVVPILTMIHFEESKRYLGVGTKVMQHWEDELRSLGYKAVMTSTQVDETSQHFYRKMGYKDCGCLVLNDIPGMEQPMEMFLIKSL